MGNQPSAPDRGEMAAKTGVFATRDKGLTTVPDKVWAIANLRTLDLGGNKLLKLPDKISSYSSSLKTLTLDHNKLTDLPAAVTMLGQCQALNVSHNAITSLPPGLGSLTKLKTLQVSHNALRALPDSLCALKSLAQLDASHNRLSELPAGFGALSDLTQADLSNNQLGPLPIGLDGLKRLKDLDCRHNAPLVVHGSVPPELLLHTPLHRLELDPEMLGTDMVLSEAAAGSAEARAAYLERRKARIDKELHSKDRGGDIRFGQ